MAWKMEELVEKINSSVYRNYPRYKGIKPRVMVRKGDQNLSLIYQTVAKTPDGLDLPLLLRIEADPEGNICSISGSK